MSQSKMIDIATLGAKQFAQEGQGKTTWTGPMAEGWKALAAAQRYLDQAEAEGYVAIRRGVGQHSEKRE